MSEALSWRQRAEMVQLQDWWVRCADRLTDDEMRLHYRQTHPRVQRLVALQRRQRQAEARATRSLRAEVVAMMARAAHILGG